MDSSDGTITDMKTTLGSWRGLGALAAFALFASTLARGQVSKNELFSNPFALSRISGLGKSAALSVAKVDGDLHAYLMTFPGRGSRLLAQVRIREAGMGRIGLSEATSAWSMVFGVVENEKTDKVQTRLTRLRVVMKDRAYSIEHDSAVLVGWRLSQGTCNLHEKYVYALDTREHRILRWPADRLPTTETARALPWDRASREVFLELRMRSGLIVCPPALRRGFVLPPGCMGGPSASYSLTSGHLTLSPTFDWSRLRSYAISPKGFAVDQLGAPWRVEYTWPIKANRRATLVSPSREKVVIYDGEGAASSEVDLGGRIDSDLVGKKGHKIILGPQPPRQLFLPLRYGRDFSQIRGVRYPNFSSSGILIKGGRGLVRLSARVAKTGTDAVDGFLLLAWRGKDGKDHLLRSKSGEAFLDPDLVRPISARPKGSKSDLHRRIEFPVVVDVSSRSRILLSQFVLVDRKTGKACASRIYTRSIRVSGDLDTLWPTPSRLEPAALDALRKTLLAR